MPGPGRSRILITRPQPGAGDTAQRVAALGLVPVVAPLLAIRRLTSVLPDPGAVQAVLVTSGNALPGLDGYTGLPLLAVGDATAARARAAGFAQVASAAGDAAALAALAAAACDPAGAPLLLATGRGQGAPLVAALRARGFRVLRRAVYAAEPVTRLPDAAGRALAAGSLRAVLFFSAETASCFASLVGSGKLTATDAIVIAEAAAAPLRHLPWRCIHVAARPNQYEMLARLQ